MKRQKQEAVEKEAMGAKGEDLLRLCCSFLVEKMVAPPTPRGSKAIDFDVKICQVLRVSGRPLLPEPGKLV